MFGKGQRLSKVTQGKAYRVGHCSCGQGGSVGARSQSDGETKGATDPVDEGRPFRTAGSSTAALRPVTGGFGNAAGAGRPFNQVSPHSVKLISRRGGD